MFTKEEWIGSNCEGRKGKRKLDPVRIKKIQAALFKLWPLEGEESIKMPGRSTKRLLVKGGDN